MHDNNQEIIRKVFLKPEVRAGVPVGAELKAVWKVMLDILEVFIGVCEKHHLTYWLEGGSMLGAVRHKGFIPWDDDIDVAMPRADFEKLQKILPGELPPHLFMQTSETDPEYAAPLMKIRDSRTTGIDSYHVKCGLKFNMGVFVDVNPIDVWVEDVSQRRRMFRAALFWKGVRRYLYYRKLTSFADRIKRCVAHLLLCMLGNRKMYELRENPFRKLVCNSESDFAIIPAHYGWDEKTLIKGEWIKDFVEVPFEYLKVKIPIGYEQRLTTMYGDWKTPRKGGAFHGDIIFDVNRSYVEVLRERFGYR